MAMVLIIVGSVFLVGIIALVVSRKVEHGEARFGPDGQIPPHEPQVRKPGEFRVTIKQDSKTDD